MGSSSSRIRGVPDGEKLVQETGFSAAHIVRLYERFQFLDQDKRGRLSPQDFGAVQELALNPIRDRIIGAFFAPGQETVDFASFVRVLAHFRPADSTGGRGEADPEAANSSARKLKFVFQMFDQDADGKISRAELLQVLQAMMGTHVTEEQLQSIAARAIQEADLDQDGVISFDEFSKSLEKINLDHRMSVRFLR